MKYNRILVVDDSATSRLIVRRCFEMAGFSDAVFMDAVDGGAALDLLRTNDVDLVVTDLKMPRVDGLTLIRKLRNLPKIRDIPVVIISSVADASEDDPVLHSGIVAVIQKPLSPAKLMHAFRED